MDVIKIMFVCHGNICRSPMAYFIMKKLIKDYHLENKIYIDSSATSKEEIGNDIYYKAKEILIKNNIEVNKHEAKQFKLSFYNEFDYIYVMEEYNKINLLKIVKKDNLNKIKLLNKKGIEDPWYTNNFLKVYNEIYNSLNKILDDLNLI